MAAPRKIPPKLLPDMMSMIGDGKNAKDIAAWLLAEHQIVVTDRGVSLALAKEGKKQQALMAPIAQAVAKEKALKTVGANVDAVEGIIQRAVKDETRSRPVADVEEKLEAIVEAKICDYMDSNGAWKPWDQLTKKQQLAVVRFKIEEVTVPGIVRHDDGEEVEMLKGRVISVTLGDPVRASKELSDLRQHKVERELSTKARDQQLKARSLQLELAGAKTPPGESAKAIRERLEAKLAKLEKPEVPAVH